MTLDEILTEEIDAYDALTAEGKEQVKANLPAVRDRILQGIKEMSELYSRVRVVIIDSPFESREGDWNDN